MPQSDQIQQMARLLLESRNTVAFTGAGISAESGIPPFRGAGGIWNNYDPNLLELNHFLQHSVTTWPMIKTLFYDVFRGKQPNVAHQILAKWEQSHQLSAIITQNIDHLHQQAGSRHVIDFHGNAHRLICLDCRWTGLITAESLEKLPPFCPKCGQVLKPDFVFFGEGIPTRAYDDAIAAVSKAELLLVIGTSGEVSPANMLPGLAKSSGAYILEINAEPSHYTASVSNTFIQGKAGAILPLLDNAIYKLKNASE